MESVNVLEVIKSAVKEAFSEMHIHIDPNELKGVIMDAVIEVLSDEDNCEVLINALQHQIMDLESTMEKKLHELENSLQNKTFM